MTQTEVNLYVRRQYYKNVGQEVVLTARGTPRKNRQWPDKKTRTQFNNQKMRERFVAKGLTTKGLPRKRKNPAGRPAVC